MAYASPREVVESAARTEDGDSGAIALADQGSDLNLLVDVTDATGTSPTLDLTVEWSHDEGTTWAAGDPADAFTQLTEAGAVARRVAVKAPTYRLVWTVDGTSPSFTFSVLEYVT